MRTRLIPASAVLFAVLSVCSLAVGQGRCVVPPHGLVSWWTGDTDESDLYGVNNSSAVNAVTLVPAEVLDGFTFGTGAYIDIPASNSLANQKFTWDAWVNPQGPGPNNDNYGSVIVDQSSDGADAVIELTWRATDNHFLFLFGNINSELIVSNDAFPPDSFYLVAGTYDGSTFWLYVNGALEGSYAETKTLSYSSNGWTIGAANAFSRSDGYPRTWNGIIDEVEAFNTALPQTAIEAIYKAGSAGKCKAAVVLTPFSVNFGTETVGTTSGAKAVTVLNNRDASVTINSFAFAGKDKGDFAETSTTCGSALVARKTCQVDITFTPQATGTRTAELEVNDTASGSPQTVKLVGTGQ